MKKQGRKKEMNEGMRERRKGGRRERRNELVKEGWLKDIDKGTKE